MFPREMVRAICRMMQKRNGQVRRSRKQNEKEENPTNIASVHLVMGCPNARAGVKIVDKKIHWSHPMQKKKNDPITNYHCCWCGSIGTNIGREIKIMSAFSLPLSRC